MQITKGFKYRLYLNKEQQKQLNHCCFIYNQAYNICLDLQNQTWNDNKDKPKEERVYLKSSELDFKIKQALKNRELPFKTVIAQRARINAEKALQEAIKKPERGFPKFKNSSEPNQSFTWNNQGCSIKIEEGKRFGVLRLMKDNFKFRCHRALPKNYKLNEIGISRKGFKYYVAFSITYEEEINAISKEKVQTAIGLDLNVNEVGLSSNELVETRSKQINKIKYSKAFKRLQRKQSRRVEKAKRTKVKLGKNFRKTQRKLNKKYEKAVNIKKDIQHKFSKEIVDKFDLIVVENLNVKNMTKRAKLKNVKAKSGLNRSILDTSFSQLISFLEYKASHNGKLFTKIAPQYTSKGCSNCGTIKFDLKLKDRTFVCDACGFVTHRDLNAAINILRRGLKALGIPLSQIKEIKLSNVKSKSFELGISLLDSKQLAFRVSGR